MGNLTQEEIQGYTDRFHKFDKSGDGTMSFPEMAKMIRSLGYTEEMVTDANLADMFLEFDKDKSKALSLQEFLQIFGKKPRSEIDEANIRKIFRDINPDDDYITADELKKAMCHLTDKDIEAMIKQVDTSGDGKINENEFMAIWKK